MAIFGFKTKRQDAAPSPQEESRLVRESRSTTAILSSWEDRYPPPLDTSDLPDSDERVAASARIDHPERAAGTGFSVPNVEVGRYMESNDNLPPAYPFNAADMDIDMIDKIHASPSNGSAPAATVAPGSPVDMARQLAAVVQDLVRQVNEQEVQRRQFEQRVRATDESARAYESLKQTLREATATSISDEDLQAMQRVLQGLVKDPNHIMVLASVAQQAQNLLTVVNSFAQLHAALRQAPPR